MSVECYVYLNITCLSDFFQIESVIFSLLLKAFSPALVLFLWYSVLSIRRTFSDIHDTVTIYTKNTLYVLFLGRARNKVRKTHFLFLTKLLFRVCVIRESGLKLFSLLVSQNNFQTNSYMCV